MAKLGYGTGTAWYKSKPGDLDAKLVEATKTAVKIGYYHLDGAEVYNTELELGKAIKECGVSRDKLFITTKVTDVTSNIQEHLDASLKKLGLDYVDLYLLHSPFNAPKGDRTVLQKAWAAMEQIQASGKSKSIGVSNFYREHLDAILETAKVRPAMNQIEYHPYLQHGDLIAYHRNKGIKLVRPLNISPVPANMFTVCLRSSSARCQGCWRPARPASGRPCKEIRSQSRRNLPALGDGSGHCCHHYKFKGRENE